jgi:hypothetical protein
MLRNLAVSTGKIWLKGRTRIGLCAIELNEIAREFMYIEILKVGSYFEPPSDFNYRYYSGSPLKVTEHL